MRIVTLEAEGNVHVGVLSDAEREPELRVRDLVTTRLVRDECGWLWLAS